MDPKPPLAPEETARFRALNKSANVLLLLLRLDRPVGAREIADILGLEEHTTARYLRQLSRLNLVTRSFHKGGYALLQGSRQQILGAASPIATVENLQFEATTSTTLIGRNRGDEETVVEEPDPTVENLQFGTDEPDRNVKKYHFEYDKVSTAVEPSRRDEQPTGLEEITQALRAVGIGEPKRSALARLPHLTPQAVRAWEMQLKQDKGERYSTGLLVYVLESGDPHPPLNEFGHLEDCKCMECRALGYRRCPYCGRDPCECEEGESEE